MNGSDRKKFGEKLKYLRATRQMTQRQVATTLNISLSSLASYETGYRRPSLEMLRTFAKFYNVSIADLLEDEPGALFDYSDGSTYAISQDVAGQAEENQTVPNQTFSNHTVPNQEESKQTAPEPGIPQQAAPQQAALHHPDPSQSGDTFQADAPAKASPGSADAPKAAENRAADLYLKDRAVMNLLKLAMEADSEDIWVASEMLRRLNQYSARLKG